MRILRCYATATISEEVGTNKGVKASLLVCEGTLLPFTPHPAHPPQEVRLTCYIGKEPLSPFDWHTGPAQLYQSCTQVFKSIQVCGDYKHTVNIAVIVDSYPIP